MKVVHVLKHLWDQVYKSPRKRKVMDRMWCKKNEIGRYMYLVGKYRNKKNASKLTHTVTKIQKTLQVFMLCMLKYKYALEPVSKVYKIV